MGPFDSSGSAGRSSAPDPGPRQYLSGPERRAQIVDATLKILAEQGLHAWTTSALADRVGVSEATLFRHFDSKDEILTEALRSIALALRQRVTEYQGTGDPWDRIEGLVLHVLSFVEATGGAPLMILSGQAARMSPAVRRDVMESINVVRGRLTELFSHALEESGRAPELEPAVFADLAIAIGQSTALRWMISGRQMPIEERARAMLQVLRHSVTGRREA